MMNAYFKYIYHSPILTYILRLTKRAHLGYIYAPHRLAAHAFLYPRVLIYGANINVFLIRKKKFFVELYHCSYCETALARNDMDF